MQTDKVGTRIKVVRKALGLTQAQLAKSVGISAPSLSELEKGQSNGTRHIAKFAAALKVSPLWLETGIGDPAPSDEQTVTLRHQEISDEVRAVAEKLLLLPDDKIQALSVLLGIKLIKTK